MKWPSISFGLLSTTLLASIGYLAGVPQVSAKPEQAITYFENLPTKLYYFDDTTTVLYHDYDDKVVYISEDEGKNWEKVKGVPEDEAEALIEHPFDNRYAFILTRSNKHYRTDDRGRTWRQFTVPLPPFFENPVLSFHADPKKSDYILYQGVKCVKQGWSCYAETFYTTDAFESDPKLLLSQTSKCIFAHSSKEFKHDAPIDSVFCIASETTNKENVGATSIDSLRLVSSNDWFTDDRRIIDFGVGTRLSRGVVALGVVSKFMVAALRDLSNGNGEEMVLFVSVDAKTWAKAQFPHGSNSKLKESSYTIVESTTHSIAIDVQSHPSRNIGTLFVSNSNGTFFVESLQNTHRSKWGYVDFEELVGIDGVGLANYVDNPREVDNQKKNERLKTVITFDDGSSWEPVVGPREDMHGKPIKCKDTLKCTLHLHSVSKPHNIGRVFSSNAPGFVMGVGNVGEYLSDYDDGDTFLSTDAGRTWIHAMHGAHIYEFGDQGNVIVIVNNEEATDHIRYTLDAGKTWNKHDLGIKMRAKLLTTIPDSTSQKFILLGTQKGSNREGENAVIFLDFASMRSRQCKDDDFERWYARGKGGHECIMGHKQWYMRRKPEADCFVGNKFKDPEVHEEHCPCQDFDYECDYNYIRDGDKCVPAGPEPIPAGTCASDRADEKYTGSSGYRLVPGNTCKKAGGVELDKPIEKSCKQAQRPEGQVSHQIFKFPAPVSMTNYFKESGTILVQLYNDQIWQSRNEGYTWKQLMEGEELVTYYMHSYSHDRAYIITTSKNIHYTTDNGISWHTLSAPLPPNMHNIPLLSFHPQRSDWLIWIGDKDCSSPRSDLPSNKNCHAEAYYSMDNGRKWNYIDSYVRQCSWARDSELKIDETLILCESYRDKSGRQDDLKFTSPLELVIGSNFYDKSRRVRLFENVVGFATFSEFLLVAEVPPGTQSLDLQVSLNGNNFAKGLFPPNMRLDNRAYTILESTTDAVFLHLTMSDVQGGEWGNLLKSNSNGTYYNLSLDRVNRNGAGYVDYEKMIGIDGVILANTVANADEASRTKVKRLQTKISHNDGGTWKSVTPPLTDSLGNKYDCQSTKCALHIHGYTERRDPRATYSSPSVVGLMIAVGNVGEHLKPYKESDTFLTRDAGFTWEEVHKDAHMWEFGDSGSIIVIVNDEEPTDHVQFSIDEGLTWREYNFGERLRITNLYTVPADNSRKFLLIGYSPRADDQAVAIYLDFSSLTKRQCIMDPNDPSHDDFELWSPSESREERCLFGRRTLYPRRIRDANCYIGQLDRPPAKIVETCECTRADFECEYNHVRNEAGDCVLVEGASPLIDDDTCPYDQDYWYERTAYRKIPKSSCEGGLRLDHGEEHLCPGFGAHSATFWWSILFVPFGFTALVGIWYYRKGGYRRGTIRLPDPYTFADSGPLSTLASIPWFILGWAGVAWSWVQSLPFVPSTVFRESPVRRGYRSVPVDADAQVLRFEDED